MRKPLPPHRAPDPMASVVDRLLAQLPGLQPERRDSTAPRPRASVIPGAGSLGTVATRSEIGGAQVLATWARVLLALTFGAMLALWPYGQTCGLPLLGYLVAVGVLIFAAGAGAAAAWRTRNALAHVLALVLMLYGGALILAELLPRTGYAVRHATWQCRPSTGSSLWLTLGGAPSIPDLIPR